MLSSDANQAKRSLGDVTFSPAPLNFNTSLVLNETTLYSDAYLTAALDGGSLDLSITVGGTLVYNVVKSVLGQSNDTSFWSTCEPITNQALNPPQQSLLKST